MPSLAHLGFLGNSRGVVEPNGPPTEWFGLKITSDCAPSGYEGRSGREDVALGRLMSRGLATGTF